MAAPMFPDRAASAQYVGGPVPMASRVPSGPSNQFTSPSMQLQGDVLARTANESQPLFVQPTGLMVQQPATNAARETTQSSPAAPAVPAKPTNAPIPKLGSKMHFSKEMTAGIMSLLLYYKNQGLVKGNKTRHWESVFKLVLADARQRWPDDAWKPSTISSKFINEKNRYSQWLSFYQQPSVTYNVRTGLLQTDDEEEWKAFLASYGPTRRSCAWLRTVPLGNVEVYEAVFGGDSTAGAEAGNDDDPASTPGNGGESESSETPAVRQRKRKQPAHGEPEVNRSHPAPVVDLTRHSRAKPRDKTRRRDDILAASKLISDGLKAAAAPAMPSVPPIVTEAMASLYSQWKDKLSTQELLICARKLQTPGEAQMWALFSDEATRRGLIEDWTQDE
ncbi:hypothetical protein SEPCBS119000_005626 [Sporothrix epigloea]|uniref:Myb/SANT-like domain-containing protein n=1 Tax=Sporothrix epigloea TaxID=1892477 RepID=A0ABP0DYL7_9PEZI